MTLHDVPEKQSKVSNTECLGEFDPFTGLHNANYFATKVAKIECKDDSPYSIIVADLQNLQLINWTLGLRAEKQMLESVVKVLRANCRPGEIIARLGRDEFAILLPKTTKEKGEAFVQRLKTIFNTKETGSFPIFLVFGVGTTMNSEKGLFNAYRRATKQMCQAKIHLLPTLRETTIRALAAILQKKSGHVGHHSVRVSQICFTLGQALGLSEVDQYHAKLAGLFHDLGKVSISSKILNKPCSLTENEWKEIKRHPKRSHRILKSIAGLEPVAKAVLYHHERWDGDGYPEGLKGEEIPFLARIIAVADSYDAMVSGRPYRRPLTHDSAIEELKKGSGRHYDPQIVEVFLQTDLPKGVNKPK